MDLSYGAEYEAFRAEVRDFISAHRDKPQRGRTCVPRRCLAGKSC